MGFWRAPASPSPAAPAPRAAEQMVATRGFQAVLLSIYSQVMIKHNGTIDKVEIELFSSGCGGTGGAAGGPIVAKLRNTTAATTGPLSTCGSTGASELRGTGRGHRANGAANVVADMVHTLFDPARSPRCAAWPCSSSRWWSGTS